MRIDCDECIIRGTDACADCVVTFIVDRERGAVVLDLGEERAVRALADAGLVPGLRHARDARRRHDLHMRTG